MSPKRRKHWIATNPPTNVRQPGDIITNSLGMKFSWCPRGGFDMGSPKSEEKREKDGEDETQHRVTLSKGYWIGVHELTRGLFARFVKASGYKTEAERDGGAYYWKGKDWLKDPAKSWLTPGFEQTDEHPVVCVSWNDVDAFCKWLTQRDEKGWSYRLPTEAEWEYACRAGTRTAFHFGDTISTDLVNYAGNKIYGKGVKGQYRGQTTPVGTFPANLWGLFDMHGNVWEWCADWNGPCPQSDIKDIQGGNSGDVRAVRGGSFDNYQWHCRAASRASDAPSDRYNVQGCRLVLCLE